MLPKYSPRIIAILVIFIVSTASAQVDHRVNRGNVGGTGRALDANPRLGSGGQNSPSRYVTDFGARSNALISGNMTGLGAFKGEATIPTGNGFRISLPTSGLSGFNSRSVGIPEVRSGGVPLPTYFYGREQTIADLSYIQQGLNIPGSTMLRSTDTAPQLVIPQRIEDYSSAIPDPVDLRIDVDREAQLRDIGVTKLVRPDGTVLPSVSTPGVRTPYTNAVGSSLFGIPDVKSVLPAYEKPVDTAQLLDVTGQRIAEERQTELDTITTTVQPIDTRITADAMTVDTGVNVGDTSAGDVSSLPGTPQVSSGFEVIVRRPGEVPEEPEVPAGVGEVRLTQPIATAAAPSLGFDRFRDMAKALRTAQQGGVVPKGIAAARAQDAESEQTNEFQPDNMPATALPREPSASREGTSLAAELRWASGVLESPITTFAGVHADDFNRYMLAGEEALKDGRYYDAERQFDLAHTIQPDNPLPMLHRGHALIAAGDFMSASRALQEGIRRFPQIAAFRIDLPAMAGKTTIFDVRRADLEKSLARADHYELRFLLGYLEIYSGLEDLGIENLQTAAKAAPPDSVIAHFADLILGREPLPEVSQITTPAGI